MKNKYLPLVCFILCAALSQEQTYLPLTRNMVISSNSNIKILGNHYALADSNYIGNIIIRNDTNVTIDGDSVFADGQYDLGYLIYIHNCHNITIKNFWSVKNYFYAVHADSSTDITIAECNFSGNIKDTVGWLNVWQNESGADGGGVCLSYIGKSILAKDTMQFENDGIAMYNCYDMEISTDVLSWNTAYGIKMFHTDSSILIENDCSHANRTTDPSDCSGILLYFSKLNSVTYCNFSYGGDGIYTIDNINLPDSIVNFVDDNYFAYNNCSYSPNNGIESDFTDSNTFKFNVASFSNYGIWAGYTSHSIIDSNVFANNITDGVASDHGMYNDIATDSIYSNGVAGVDFFANTAIITGYSSHLSRHQQVNGNYFTGNGTAIEIENSDTTSIASNFLFRNALGIQFDSICLNDSVHNNIFLQNVSYDIRNNSTRNIQAQNNNYSTTDTAVIDCKIFDQFDSLPDGIVYWNPYTISAGTMFQYNPPSDLCEPGLAQWVAYVQDGQPTKLSWDYSTFISGVASLKCVTSSGFQVRLHYYPANDSVASWNLSGVTDIFISFKDIDTNASGYQQQAVRIGDDCGNYIEYDNVPDTVFNTNWTTYDIPIGGNAAWTKTTVGAPSLSDITYTEVIGDTWGYGFTLWVDGLHFFPQTVLTNNKKLSVVSSQWSVYPNPSTGIFTVFCHSEQSEESQLNIEVFDVLGEKVYSSFTIKNSPFITIDLRSKSNGVYFYRILTSDGAETGSGKMVVEK